MSRKRKTPRKPRGKRSLKPPGDRPLVEPFTRIDPPIPTDGSKPAVGAAVNRTYTVLLFAWDFNGMQWVQLCVRRNDGQAIERRRWEILQEIKNLMLGAEAEAAELYPRSSKVRDLGEACHLWSPIDHAIPFGL